MSPQLILKFSGVFLAWLITGVCMGVLCCTLTQSPPKADIGLIAFCVMLVSMIVAVFGSVILLDPRRRLATS